MSTPGPMTRPGRWCVSTRAASNLRLNFFEIQFNDSFFSPRCCAHSDLIFFIIDAGRGVAAHIRRRQNEFTSSPTVRLCAPKQYVHKFSHFPFENFSLARSCLHSSLTCNKKIFPLSLSNMLANVCKYVRVYKLCIFASFSLNSNSPSHFFFQHHLSPLYIIGFSTDEISADEVKCAEKIFHLFEQKFNSDQLAFLYQKKKKEK